MLLTRQAGTYGIVTSAVVKAYPPIQVTQSVLAFGVGSAAGFGNFNFSGFGNLTGFGNFSSPFSNFTIPGGNFSNPFFNFSTPSNFSFPGGPFNLPVTVNDTEVFWKGVDEYQYYGKAICEAGGTAYSYISPLGEPNSNANSSSFSFSTTVEMPAKTPDEVLALMQPLIDKLNALGIPVNNSQPTSSLSWGANRQGEGDSPGDTRFASRLFPARNWDDDALFRRTMDAVRATIEAGYTFHGIHMMPTEETAGYPGNNSVNPAFRRTLMHADVFDMVSMQAVAGGATTTNSAAQALERAHARLNGYMDGIRAATPGGGSYINEADVQEPDWQRSFFGDKYEGLAEIKRARDPWGVFWAPTTVGSEGWEVRTADGLPTQDGMLCRVGGAS